MNIWMRIKCLFNIGLEPIGINSVLATLRLSLFATNHFLRFSKSEFTAAWRSCIESPEAVIFVLSPHKQGFLFFKTNCKLCGKSFIHSKKDSDPKTEHWGRPHVNNRLDKKKFLTKRSVGFCISDCD